MYIETFQVWRARWDTVSTDGLLAGLPNLKKFLKKINFFFFFEIFQVRWAHRQAVGTDGLPATSPNLECAKSLSILSGD
jgi:hypothetical protein